jgi:hypothetical protein
MLQPNVLPIAIKGLMSHTYIQVLYPPHDEVLMGGTHQRLERIKHIELESSVTIHVKIDLLDKT